MMPWEQFHAVLLMGSMGLHLHTTPIYSMCIHTVLFFFAAWTKQDNKTKLQPPLKIKHPLPQTCI